MDSPAAARSHAPFVLGVMLGSVAFLSAMVGVIAGDASNFLFGLIVTLALAEVLSFLLSYRYRYEVAE